MTASICALEKIAALLGQEEVNFLSQDAKARVPIGITAANKQAPLMMHVEYQVRLPDHDFLKAPGHKLIIQKVFDTQGLLISQFYARNP